MKGLGGGGGGQMMLALEWGDRRLVLAEEHRHGEGQRGRREGCLLRVL